VLRLICIAPDGLRGVYIILDKHYRRNRELPDVDADLPTTRADLRWVFHSDGPIIAENRFFLCPDRPASAMTGPTVL
jgi:hypothetical protein